MPFVEHKLGRNFNTFETTQEPEPEAPGVFATFQSAFKLENTVANVGDLLSRPVFEPTEGFKVRATVQEYDKQNRTSFFENYPDNFLGVQSEAEMLDTITRIKEEEVNRDILARAGWLGVVAGVGAGLVSPEIFLPFVGEARGLKALISGTAIGLSTGVATEGVLAAAQETRQPGEIAIGIAASTALGGILGGTIGVLRKGEREIFEQEITSVARRPQGVGADAVQSPSAGNLASGALTIAKLNDKTGVFTNPVTQNITQTDFETWRVLMQQASDSGLSFERNADFIPGAVGGTIENSVLPYFGQLGKMVNDFDANYAKYFFDNDVPSFAPNVRASLGGTFNAGGKLSKSQFADEVTRALWNGGEHEIPEVAAAAKSVDQNVYAPILKEAQSVGLMGDDIEVVGDKGYANRLYNIEAIQTKTAEFIKILEDNYNAQLSARFTKDLDKFKLKQSRAEELAGDLTRPDSEVEEMVAKFKEDLDEVEEALPEEISAFEEAIRDKRAQARLMLKQPDSLANEHARKSLLKDARDMEKASPKLGEFKKAKAEIKRRLRNLTQSRAGIEKRLQRKLDLWDASEDASIASLRRLVKAGQTALAKLDKVSDANLDKEVSKIKDQFEKTARAYDRGEERLVKLAENDEDMHRLGATEDLQTSRAIRLDEIAVRLEEAENLPREEIRALITEGMEESIAKVAQLNARRGARQRALLDQAKKLDPAQATARAAELRKAIPAAEGEFGRKWEGLGAEGVDATTGVADFKSIARSAAEEVKDTIVGTYLRLPYSEVLGKERGSELVRVLDIPSAKLEKFLEKDINKLAKTYVRTMAPDIEIARKWGSLDWREIIKPAVDELNMKIEQIDKEAMKEGGDATKFQASKDKKIRKLNSDFEVYKKNFEAVVGRLRGTRGLPSDPDGFAYRAARTVMNLNVLRMMGMVTVSSFPDLARPVMRYGLTRTFRDGFKPLIGNFKMFKLNAQEARLSGAALDPVMHTRAMAIRDLTDDLQRGSKFEKAVEFATNRMGMVALFDQWTQGGKLLTSSIANAKLMGSLAAVNGDASSVSVKEATRYLAEVGFNENLARDVWKQVTDNAGGGKVDGVWYPNTESWKDQGLVNVYRQALAREINNTIIAPGVERPLLSDVNMLGRMLYQFKSFGMSSMPKIVMAGMQQRDAAVLSGSLASLGLGALSYYLWAVATGGRAYDEMLEADIDKWADEAISRSGLVATVGELQRIGGNIPLISDYTSFSGKRQTRRPGDNLVESLLGPSFDFGENALGVVGGIHDPTQATLNQFVKLVPYQNTLVLREGIEAVQNALGANLPERRN